MSVIFALVAVALLYCLFNLPQWWAMYQVKRHNTERDDLAATGADFARLLLDGLNLSHVQVKRGKKGEDYYDPEARIVSLSPDHYDRRSVSALCVAAHECGHALQHRDEDPMLMHRQRLTRVANGAQRIGMGLLGVLPFVALVSRSPILTLIGVAASFVALVMPALVHAVTVKVEYDASFRKAMPILAEGGYLTGKDLLAADSILKACALTYLAASLASIVNLARWLMILLRR